MKRLFIISALVAIVALPFVLRPKRAAVGRADDTVAIVTPHNEAIRYEFTRGFAEWYKQRTGRTVSIDWRIIGGTSDIARFLEGEYVAAFEHHWTRTLGRPWSAEIQAGFHNGRLAADAPAIVKEARAAFLASDVGCSIDVFFGGGTYDFERQAQAGRLVDAGVMKAHPEWFTDAVIPKRFGGEDYWQRDGLWIGTVLSSYGIIYNRDALKRLGFEREPTQWSDLADPRLVGEVGLADPTKSGSVAKAFENIIQQQMQRRLHALQAETPGADPAAIEARAVREGWMEGMRLLQRIGANARYFTDTSQKPPIDVATGNCAAGLCIDFYGRQQQEAVRRRDHSDRIGYAAPTGGSVSSVDPIALLRGAKNRPVATAFMEYVLSLEGQKLWNFKTGVPGGPQRFVLRRLPVRRDFYATSEWRQYLTDPNESPYDEREPLIYREAWTGRIFREMAFITRIMCQDTHAELKQAWRAILAAPEPAKSQALAVMQELAVIDYDRTSKDIRGRLNARDKVEEVRLAKELASSFRASYARAEAIARGAK
ncbi:ABC transporter substrate-binding protein [Horticoccus sp. 23ND18S-11]|uniref:ABC transporter substrate-binding protein n=1 Tax=Horticoccus sp. 23ND18S-11 TaxID=3391832 RepID=UPI0039C96870